MKIVKGLLPLIILTLLAGGTFLVLNSLSSEDLSPTETSANVPTSCKKLGINFAWPGPVADDQIDKAAALNMGYSLEIVTTAGQVWGLGLDSFDHELNNGITPILRACVGETCEFGNKSNPGDASAYVAFINQLADIVQHNRTIYVIAGPNEPISETWLGGTPGNVNQIAPKVAAFMNAVIDGVDRPNVKLLSPAFNTTHPEFLNMVQALRDNGARFNELDGIAGNAYNWNGYSLGETITEFVDRMRTAGFSTEDIFLTEIGMFESNRNPNGGGVKIPHEQAKLNLAAEIEKLKVDDQVKAYLLFDSFGTNPDTNFEYNFIEDNEFPAIIGTECVGSGASATPTPTPSPTATSTPTPTPTPTSTVTSTVTPTPTVSTTLTPTPTATFTTQACGPRDTNGDGKLTIVDYRDFSKLYGKSLCSGDPITTGCGSRDTNGDGKLTIIDYRDFAKLYGKTCAAQ